MHKSPLTLEFLLYKAHTLCAKRKKVLHFITRFVIIITVLLQTAYYIPYEFGVGGIIL